MPSVAIQWPYAVLQIEFDKKSCIYAGFLFHFCFYNFARKFLSNSGFLQHFLTKTNGWIRRKQTHTHQHTYTQIPLNVHHYSYENVLELKMLLKTPKLMRVMMMIQIIMLSDHRDILKTPTTTPTHFTDTVVLCS